MAAGVDGQTFEDIEAYGEERWLDELAQELKKRTYQPLPVRRVYIPKPDGKQRPLGVPAIRDRTAEMAAVLVLDPPLFVPADCHRNTFWDSAPHHVSHGSPTQIMKEQLGNFRFCADLCPGDAKVAPRFAMRACEHAVIVWHDLNFKYRDFRPPNASTSAPSSANSYSVFSGRD